jgi:cellulose synthase/poly-beta-1,6-N-acetylglucosamine synthase-like glycosyltransferase
MRLLIDQAGLRSSLFAVATFSPVQILCFAAFLVAGGAIVYVLFGYPLLLGWIAKRHNHPVKKDDQLRSVSIIIAVRNGEKFIRRKLESVLALNYPRELVEIIVVSDGSDDRTDEIAREFEAQRVRLLRVPRGGKAVALNAAVPCASGEILIFTDVRQQVDPQALRNLIANFGDPGIGAVSGELAIVNDQTQEESDTSLYWKYELWLRKQMCRIDSSFGCTGAFYGVRRSLFQPFPPDILLDDAYLPLTIFLKGYRVVYEPTAQMYDLPTALDSEFRRKVRTQAGLYQFLRIMPELLSAKNRMCLHFLSGKFGRMIIPYCLILMAVATIGMSPGWRMAAAIAQLGFYLLALLDYVLPASFPLKHLTSPIRTFVVLMTASLLGVKVLFVSSASLWKETKVRHPAA